MPLKIVASRNKKTKSLYIRVRTSELQWTRAAALTGDPSLANYSGGSNAQSSVVNIRHVNFHVTKMRKRS
jgi:hypothetical protein